MVMTSLYARFDVIVVVNNDGKGPNSLGQANFEQVRVNFKNENQNFNVVLPIEFLSKYSSLILAFRAWSVLKTEPLEKLLKVILLNP